MGRLIAMLILTACGEGPPVETPQLTGTCGEEGRFNAELFGAFAATIDWEQGRIECEGMRRPNDAGARLRFAGEIGEGEASVPLAIILGIPNLKRGETGMELPTNVTVIDEREGRFFATQDVESCWSDIDRQQPHGDEASGKRNAANEFVISGILYCVSPLAELRGPASLRLSEARFVGLLDWARP